MYLINFKRKGYETMSKNTARFFLGANSKSGFYSLYDGFTDPAAGDFLWVLKGGPGCGKSTFMKRIGAAGEDAGEAVEYIHCSGDPDSLDGVYLPAHRIAYVDGTAPHVIEAVYPGAASLYLDLGSYFDAAALSVHLPEIMELNRRYKACYADAYRLLSAGAALLPKNVPGLCGAAQMEKIDKKLAGLAARELPRQQKPGTLKKRFLSAWSCAGHMTLTDTLHTYADRVYLLDNDLGLGNNYLARLAEIAVERGYDVILCPDPLEPEKSEALILPERGIAFFAAEQGSAEVRDYYRHIRLDALVEPEDRAALRKRKRESGMLLSEAVTVLAGAKRLHDALEDIYHPHVNFEGVSALAEEHIDWIFGA